jgi:hypothetical protein
VNFFGHLVLARALDPDLAFGFGAMWPDFSGILGLKAASTHAGVHAGVAFHHRVDAVFHRERHFVTLQRLALERLQRHGVPRGPARAVAHVGVELLLDAELARNDLETLHYRTVLKHAQSRAQGWFPSLDEACSTRVGHWCQRLDERAERIIPESPQQLTKRLADILESRPRLALPAAAWPLVSDWIAEIWPQIQQVRDPWLASLKAQLSGPSALEPSGVYHERVETQRLSLLRLGAPDQGLASAGSSQ